MAIEGGRKGLQEKVTLKFGEFLPKKRGELRGIMDSAEQSQWRKISLKKNMRDA